MRTSKYHKSLNPNTPWQVRRRIRALENDIYRLETWRYRVVIGVELLIIAMLFMCALHFKIRFT